MKGIRLSVVLIAALFFFGCDHGGELVHSQADGSLQEAAPARTAGENGGDPGTLYERSFVHDGTPRSYLLYVPAAYDGEDDWPLVISYHGFNVGAAFQVDLSRMNPVADTEHFLIAYPQGLPVNNPFTGTVGPGWNVIDGTLSENDDLNFSLELIDHVDAAYEVDRSRIHATGWSMGAAMAYDMVCSHPDQIASVAGVANQMSDSQIDTCAPNRALSFLQIHGTADPIVPFDGVQGGDLVFSAAPETASFWAEQNNCSSDPLSKDLKDVVTDDNSTVTLFEYTGCDHGTEVLFYQVNNGGHTWPGGGPLPAFLGAINRDIDASTEIWDFFARNPHSGAVQVCHAPPGNPANARTIAVSVNALPAHLAHGDTEGPCPEVD